MAILKDLLDNVLDLTNIGHVVFWSDGGRHFRSNRSIATVGIRTVQKLCEKSSLNDDINAPTAADKTNFKCTPCFGIPKHFKNMADTEFGILKQNMMRACMNKEVNDFDAAFQTWVDMDAMYRKTNPNRKKIFFRNFVPPERKSIEDWTIQFSRASYKETIANCFSYEFRINDTRRGNS